MLRPERSRLLLVKLFATTAGCMLLWVIATIETSWPAIKPATPQARQSEFHRTRPVASQVQVVVVSGQPRSNPVRQLADLPSAAPDATNDLRDWKSLPRTNRDLISDLVVAPQRLTVSMVLRSCTFNPNDAVLTDDDQLELDGLMQRHTTRIAEVARARDLAEAAEFTAAHLAGETLPTCITSLVGRSNLQRLGSHPVLRVVDGEPHGAPRSSCPNSSRLEGERLAATVVWARDLVDFFVRCRALPAWSGSALVERVAQRTRETSTM